MPAAFNNAVASASSNFAGPLPGSISTFTPQNYAEAQESGYVATEGFMGPGRPGQALATSGSAFFSQETISAWDVANKAEYNLRATELAKMDLGPNDVASRYYSPKDQDYYDSRPLEVEEAWVGAGLTDIPTSSTNFARPRTVAAGWDANPDNHELGTLTVVFRDGTPYNFYDVERSVWLKFHQSISKGRPFLNKKSFTDLYKHGPADTSEMSPDMLNAVYMAARTTQLYYRAPKGTSGYSYQYKTKPDGTRVKFRTYGTPQNPTKANTNPAINRQNAATAAKAAKATARNTSAQKKK
jgi:hypothetical protein